MDPASRQLHLTFLPFMASGHSIPMLDIVRLFTARDNVTSTVITTPLNAPNIIKSFENRKTGSSSIINVHVIPFPSHEGGVLNGIESLDNVTSQEMQTKFVLFTELLRNPVERFLGETMPDYLIADLMFPFATDSAAKFGIPRLVFHGNGFFSTCALTVLLRYEPHKSVLSDDEAFILPNLPHKVKLMKSEIYEPGVDNDDMVRFFIDANQATMKSYGDIFNSFYEFEPDYVDYYKNVLMRKCWCLGPVSLSNRNANEKFYRGKTASISEDKCLKWLDSKERDSVIYVCFGSMIKFLGRQLNEIALGLESSGQRFIWVLSKDKGDDEEKWLCDGFEERVKDRGLIVRGWAPQVLILEHEAVGGFVTHCGWNSTLEGVSGGVSMVTWPRFADQFYNEKLITDILRIGVQVGSRHWSAMGEGTFVKRDEIKVALMAIMEGDEAFEMRSRAKKLKGLAREAVEEGGSSYSSLSSLIKELGCDDPDFIMT